MLAALLAAAVAGAASPALASNNPPPPDTVGPCVNKASFTATTYQYVLCGMPDLDQVRWSVNGMVGLPNNGYLYCVPTATMNILAYLASLGFVNEPANKDWTLPANYSEMSNEIAKLGQMMGTDPFKGTGGTQANQATTQWLIDHGTPQTAVKGVSNSSLYLVTKSYVFGNGYSPDPVAMAQDVIAGGLAVTVEGFYAKATDPATNETHLMRVGGHATTLVDASGTVGTTAAVLGVRDPDTDANHNAVQSPYRTGTWNLSAAAADTYFWKDDQGAFHTYQATLPAINGSSTVLYDAYGTIEPKVVESVVNNRVVFEEAFVNPYGPPNPGPYKTIDPGGQVISIALAPEGAVHPFLTKGSNTVKQVDELTGKVTPFANGPQGASTLAFGGRLQTLFVAGRNQLVAFDRHGATVAKAGLAGPLSALSFDSASGRVVGLSASRRQLLFFDTSLHRIGSARVSPAALSGKGTPSLAISPNGTIVLHAQGSKTLVQAPPAAAHSAAALGRVKLIRRTVPALAGARGLAIDDQGNLFTNANGQLLELDPSGHVLRGSRFNGLPAGNIIDVSRSFSNFEPGIDPPTLDFLPPNRGRPDLVVSSVEAGHFTVTNQGEAASPPFEVSIAAPRGGTAQTITFPSLDVGESADRPYQCGEPRQIVIDPTGQVDESNEDNNTATTVACTRSSG